MDASEDGINRHHHIRNIADTVVVDIAGAEIGTAAQLVEVLGVEGATELNDSAFSSEGLSFTLRQTGDGKAKATVTPAGSPPSFFLRVKVK